MTTHRFALAERVADAVLYEGYVLYPYRASSTKNRYRWQFGVIAPRSPRNDGEPWFAQSECVVTRTAALSGDLASAPSLTIRVRCLRPRETTDSAAHHGWLEGDPHVVDVTTLVLDHLPLSQDVSLTAPLGLTSRLTIEAEAGAPQSEAVADGRDQSTAIAHSSFHPFIKVRMRLENLEPWRCEFANARDAMLQRSFAGAHLLCAIDNGSFESLVEPRLAAHPLVSTCRNLNMWPVLIGDRTARDLLLCSPIVLYDYPAVANESPGDLCDATEIDEILTMRVLTMTDAEKNDARATDPRSRAIVDRVEAMPSSALEALHGTMRSADFFNPPDTPSPDDATVVVAGHIVGRGSRVILRPSRRADAMDMFLRDQPATVAGVYRDVDDRVYVAVTVDRDPAAVLHESFGRFFYFDPSEVEPTGATSVQSQSAE